MNTAVPSHCKVFLQSSIAEAGYILEALEGQPTSQLSLGAIMCQLCQLCVGFQLADTERTCTSRLYKQLVEAQIIEELLEVLLDVCLVSLHATLGCIAIQDTIQGAMVSWPSYIVSYILCVYT